VDGHSAWVNSKALELNGITADTPDPAGGVIKRIPGSGGQYGEPAGLLQESAAGLVAHLFPPPTKEQYKAGLLWLQEWFNSVGITTAHDAMVSVDDPDYYMAYEELAREGLLTVRYRGSWHLDPEMAGAYGSGGGTGGYMAAIDEGLTNSAEFQTPHWQIYTF
jgi:predicted amidohydrolase YtcJ